MSDSCPYVLIVILIILTYYFFFNINENYGVTNYLKTPMQFNNIGKILSDEIPLPLPDTMSEFRKLDNEGSWETGAYNCSWSNPKWNSLEQGTNLCRQDPLCKGVQMYKNGSGHCLFKGDLKVNKDKKNLVRYKRNIPKKNPIDSFVKLSLGSWETGSGSAIPYNCADEIPNWESPDEAARRCILDDSCDGFDMREDGRGGCLYKNALKSKTIESKKTRYARISPAEICRSKGLYWVQQPSKGFKCQALKVLK